MRNRLRVCLALSLGALLCAPVYGTDATAGKALHDKHCVACHARLTNGEPASLYTRENRLVTSLEGLHKQVRRCEQNLELRWFDEDIDNVAAYLNQAYYQFEQ